MLYWKISVVKNEVVEGGRYICTRGALNELPVGVVKLQKP